MADDYHDIVITDAQKRLVAGFANVAVLDRQGDIVPTDAMAKAMLDYMARGGVVLLGHANKPVGKVVQWSVQKPEGSNAEGIHIIAMIDSGTGVGDDAWKGLQEKTITGFSIGGVAGKTENVRDKGAVGGVARELKEVELHEISLVQIPANQLATVESISVAKSCDNGGCDMDMDDNGTPLFTTRKQVAKMIDEKLGLAKEVHKGPFDTWQEADQVAQQLKQEGKVVYRVPERDGKWYVDYGFALNPANTETPRLEQHPKPKKGPYQSVLMAMKAVAGVSSMGLAWEATKEQAESVAKEITEAGFTVFEIVPDGVEWRVDYGVQKGCSCGGACDCHAEKAEDAAEEVTVKEPNGNYDQTKYGNQVDGGLVKGGNEATRRRVGLEYAGSKVRSVGPNGERGTWHRMLDSEKEQVRLFGAGELAAATNVPSGFQPAQPIPKKDVEGDESKKREEHLDRLEQSESRKAEGAVSTSEDGVENVRYSPEQEEKAVPVEKPFKSRAQQRWMFWQHPKMAREWAGKTDFSSLPERASKKDVAEPDSPADEESVGHENESQAPTGDEAFATRADGPQGEIYGEFGEKGVVKESEHCKFCVADKEHSQKQHNEEVARAGVTPQKQFDASLQPEQMKPGYQHGDKSPTGTPIMHAADSCDLCGKPGATRRGVCEDCMNDAVNEARAKKELKKEPAHPEDDANVGPNGLAGETALQSDCGCEEEKKDSIVQPVGVKPTGEKKSVRLLRALGGIQKDSGRSGKCTQCGEPSDYYTEDTERPVCGKCSRANKSLVKSGACRRCGTTRKRLYKRQRGVICGKCIKAVRTKALKTLAGVKR